MYHKAHIQQLENRAAWINQRLKVLNGPTDSHLEGVAKSFHLGMVGGSGRNTARLNQRRERSLENTVANAKEATKLHNELQTVEAKIKDLKEGGPEKRAKKRQERAELLSQYWRGLKAGDSFDIGNGPTSIIKKNRKSLISAGGCTWSAAEIIGKDAAALL